MSIRQQRVAGALVLLALAALLALMFWPEPGMSDQECRAAGAWSSPECREAARRDYEAALP